MRAVAAAMLVAVALSTAQAESAFAGPIEDAAAAGDRGDYATMMRLLRPLAEKGDAFAQYWVGWLYDTGLGVPQDFAEATTWYRKSADQGDPDGQLGVGQLYFGGRST